MDSWSPAFLDGQLLHRVVLQSVPPRDDTSEDGDLHARHSSKFLQVMSRQYLQDGCFEPKNISRRYTVTSVEVG
jgi:hypothetical protein